MTARSGSDLFTYLIYHYHFPNGNQRSRPSL